MRDAPLSLSPSFLLFCLYFSLWQLLGSLRLSAWEGSDEIRKAMRESGHWGAQAPKELLVGTRRQIVSLNQRSYARRSSSRVSRGKKLSIVARTDGKNI